MPERDEEEGLPGGVGSGVGGGDEGLGGAVRVGEEDREEEGGAVWEV